MLTVVRRERYFGMDTILDPTFLARFQFAFTVSYHIIFPALSIGLAGFLLLLESLLLWKKDKVYETLFDYWKRIFSLTFVMGTVTGLTLSFQFGTNWSVFSEKTGAILGPLITYETLTAFFLEALSLGVILLGRKRVSKPVHFIAVLVMALGSVLSAFWILAANSWMHTPAGFYIDHAGNFAPSDWLAIIFNPSMPYRFAHMTLAAFLASALFIAGIGAWHLKKEPNNIMANKMFRMAMWLIVVLAPLQLFSGDQHGLNTREYQPAKIAALEGHFEPERGAPLILFGIPDDKAETVHYPIEIPKLGSLILTHSLNGKVHGLSEFPKDKRPPSEVLFWTFRIMVGLGFLMLGLAGWFLVLYFKKQLSQANKLYSAALWMAPSGIVAILAGWITTEVGRQPYVVYHQLLTQEAVSNTPMSLMSGSFAAFVAVYLSLMVFAILYLIKLLKLDPENVNDSVKHSKELYDTH